MLTIHPINPVRWDYHTGGTRKRNYADVPDVSVSVRGLDTDSPSFRVNDLRGVLGPPLPVFTEWTAFEIGSV